MSFFPLSMNHHYLTSQMKEHSPCVDKYLPLIYISLFQYEIYSNKMTLTYLQYLQNKQFVLKIKFQRSASNFAIF